MDSSSSASLATFKRAQLAKRLRSNEPEGREERTEEELTHLIFHNATHNLHKLVTMT